MSTCFNNGNHLVTRSCPSFYFQMTVRHDVEREDKNQLIFKRSLLNYLLSGEGFGDGDAAAEERASFCLMDELLRSPLT